MRNLAICVLIVIVVVALYEPVMRYSFVGYDDDIYVTDNSHVKAGFSWATLRWAFVSTEKANWHPLTWISHALDVELFGLQPSGHHAVSVALHAVNSMVLFLLAFYSTGRRGPSLVLAFLFAVHPINVESVTWIAERKNVLSTFFFLLSLAAYGWYSRRPHWTRYTAVAVLFACGLMAKPMLVTLPFVLLLLDYWPLERLQQKAQFRNLLVEKIPLISLSVAVSVITFLAQRAGQAVRSEIQFPFALRFENAVVAYVLYVWKTLWPARLAPFYPHPTSLSLWAVVGATVLLAVITGLVFAFRKRKYLLTGWLWFLGTLVPVIGLVQVGDQALADRYAYIPLIGLFLILAWSAADFFQSQMISPAVGATVSAAVLLGLALTTHRQIGFWSSDRELWSHTLAVTTNNSVAHRNLAVSLMLSNQPAEALAHFREATALSPTHQNYINLGTCLDSNHRPNEAIEQYKRAIDLTANVEQLASAYTDLGIAYFEINSYSDARACYARSLQLNPNQFITYFDRGLLLEHEGQLEEAAADYGRSVQLRPTAKGYYELSRVLQRLNRASEAQAAYEKARMLFSASVPE
jgi:Flp pilus assembly protein TadD